MKIVFWLLLAAFLIWAWRNPEKVRNAGDLSSKWVGEKSRQIADKWDPLPPPPPPVAPIDPPLPPLPEGVYLLTQEVMVSTGRGTVKWPAGTSIRKLGEGAGKILVSDGFNQTTVDATLLTRDEAERKFLYKKMEETYEAQARSDIHKLELELNEVEARIAALQVEKRKAGAIRYINGQSFGTPEEFFELSIQRAEQRRSTLYKLLGRTPKAPSIKGLTVK